MGTFVYAPGIRIFIDTEFHGTLDISDDIVDYTVQRRSDGPSTLNFSIQNIRRKYDQVFMPNDRIVVELKRVAWLRVFTGLLNSVPLVTAWPRVVALSASCSLKRLQYWYWDPQLAESYMTVIRAMGDAQKTADSGITNAILTLLKEVVGWPESKVHIGAIPPNWFQLVLPYARQLANYLVDSDAQVMAMMSTISSGSVGGTATGVVGSTSAGAGLATTGLFKEPVPSGVNGEVFSPGQLLNAEAIIRVGRSVGALDKEILAALIVAMQESRLKVVQSTSSSAAGLFQQLSGWGGLTDSERMDPIASSKAFYKRAAGNPSRTTHDYSHIAAYVQGYLTGSGTYTSYEKQAPLHDRFLDCAQRLVSAFNAAVNAGTSAGDPSSTAAAQQILNGTSSGTGAKPTSYQFVAQALDLVQRYPHVPYGSVGSKNELKHNPPRAVGCSGFVSWVLMSKFGSLPTGWSLQWAEDQYQWCLSHGGQTMTVEEGIKTQGALLIRHPRGGKVGHIEISVGDGETSVGAQRSGTYAGAHKAYLAQYDVAVTMPLFDYTTAKNGVPPMVNNGTQSYPGSTVNSGTVPYSDAAGFNSENPIDQLFGGLIAPESNQDAVMADQLAQAFSGPRALLNDQPLLPYIKNLVNASMRSFCSAPNGDFMAWFPDYYGLWGTAAIMVIEPIELLDFYVEWSDDFMVTHQYAVAGTTNYIDGFSGEIQTVFGDPANQPQASVMSDSRIFTAGVASIDIPAIMWALFGINVTEAQAEKYASWVYKRFGARPDFKQMDGLVGKAAEMFSAMYYFMRQWAYQYNSNIPLTFMPELWPGMLVQIPEYEFQAYVTAVTHTGQMGEGGGHSTSINIAAPARLPKAGSKTTQNLIGLPVASGMLQVNANNVTPEVVDPNTYTRGNQAQVNKNARQEGSVR